MQQLSFRANNSKEAKLLNSPAIPRRELTIEVLFLSAM
jgi:hypothetical protein